MNASEVDKKPNKVKNTISKRSKRSYFFHFFLWVFGFLAFVVFAIYIFLLFSPISLQFIRTPIQNAALKAIPSDFNVELGEISLALEGGMFPSVQFSPAIIIDKKNAAKIELKALNVGFSPIKSLFGQPSLNISLVQPHLKIIQDLLGPRIAEFEIIDEGGDEAAIYILEGENSYPSVRITPQGLDLENSKISGELLELRTDNKLAIYNFLVAEQNLRVFASLVASNKISKLRIINASLDMHDSVYGLLRQYTNINIDVFGTKEVGEVEGKFSISLAGRETTGTFKRQLDNGAIKLLAKIINIDFASLLPFLDDAKSFIALEGAGDIGLDVNFDGKTGNVINSIFEVANIDASVRIEKNYFPLRAKKIIIDWDPSAAKYSVRQTNIRIGNSSGSFKGDFILGIDEIYGPTMRMSVEAQRLSIYPNDLLAPQTPFDKMSLIGWSAPLYGATGIDYLLLTKPGVEFRVKGRIDILKEGLGVDFEVGGEGASVDDLKRLWPYFIAGEARDWFVKNVKSGTLKSTNMKFNFLPGSILFEGESEVLPKNSVSINMTAENVSLIPLQNMELVQFHDDVNLSVRDNIVTFNMKEAEVKTKSGQIEISNGSFILDSGTRDSLVYELSGDVRGEIPSLLEFSRIHLPNIINEEEFPLNLDDLVGDVKSSIVATILFDKDEIDNVDYAGNGNVTNFKVKKPIAGYNIEEGDFKFSANQNGYALNGDVNVAGFPSQFKLDGILGEFPDIQVINELSVSELKQFGFDLSNFMDGKIRFGIKILADGALQLTADLKNANINVADIGLSKAKNIDGQLLAIIRQDNNQFIISDASIKFADVLIKGNALIENSRLKSAHFPTFKLNSNDDASLTIKPVRNGFSLVINGKRMDLKPILKRAFSLDRPSAGGIRSTQYSRRLLINISLNQAIGFYKTIASNFNLKMDLQEDEVKNISLQAQFAQNNSVSISTNSSDTERTMSVAFNDAGTLLRFLNVYSRMVGGKGSLVLRTKLGSKTDVGLLALSDFSFVDEAKVEQIIGNYREGRPANAQANTISFNYGKVEFIRRSDRIEITNGVIDGGTVGGTLRGFIYTKDNRYDLNGTYIPLFGLNSIFQKLPLFGVILGGREGEGLIGVTFAVRGKLDSPNFIINPASILAPGMFRSLFEFRSREAPRPQ